MISRSAPAKVNLYLHVTGKRSDGYHLLDSLVVFAGVGDRLTFQQDPGLSLEITGPGAAALTVERDNIVLRATYLLAEKLGCPPEARISLEKNLPVAAGIGGGSADAAATLRGLLTLWGKSLPEPDLGQLGLALGADLPVCLAARPMQMTGVGEQLAPAVALPPAWLVLVNPRVGLSTPAVFKARQGDFTPASPLTAPPQNAADLATQLSTRHNDLAPPAMAIMPEIAVMLDAIQGTPSCLLARMSGSGATCFGLYATEQDAAEAARCLCDAHPNWWIAPAPILS